MNLVRNETSIVSEAMAYKSAYKIWVLVNKRRETRAGRLDVERGGSGLKVLFVERME